MNFGTIASGSSGNCLYVGSETTHLLIDAGVSGRKIAAGLSSFGIEPSQICAILVTHEHIDHTCGIGVLSRKYHIPVYTTMGTIGEITRIRSLGDLSKASFNAICPGSPFEIGDIRIEAFSISHDAVDPVSYTFEYDGKKIGMVTDLGFFDDSIIDPLKNSDLLYVEANHDIRMLQAGPYPYHLKQRILGKRGHLCNEMCGQLVSALCTGKLKHVILGHLSKENNYPDLALQTVLWEAFGEGGEAETPDVFVAPRDCASQLVVI